MCHICGQPSYYNCNCVQQINYPCTPCTTTPTGCPIQLDSACVIYHKDNNTTSLLLDGLGLNNGATLQLILETISAEIEQLNFEDLTLPFLDDTYVINNLQQFATAVDSQFSAVNDSIDDINTTIGDMGYLGAVASDPVLADTANGQYWFRTDLPAADGLRIKLNGSFRTIPTTV